MELALVEARSAGERDEVPIGAVLVLDGRVIARSGNRTRELNDVTAHAEIAVIRMACEALGQERLPGADLYVTLEPCTMCAAAISLPVSAAFITARKTRRAALWRVACASSASQPATMHRMSIQDWRKAKVLKSCGNSSARNVSTTKRPAGGTSFPAGPSARHFSQKGFHQLLPVLATAASFLRRFSFFCSGSPRSVS